MKTKQKILFITLLGAAFSASARQVGVDFAPLTSWNEVTQKTVPLQANGLAVGWHVEGAKVDGEPLDYKKVQTDEDYARKTIDQNSDAFDTKAFNVLYSVESGKSLSNLPKPKDKDGKEVTYAACFDGAAFGSNHRDCDIDYEPATGFAIFQVNFKWENGSTEAVRIIQDDKGQKAVAWGNLTDSLRTIFSKTLDKKYSEVAAYKANKDNLAFNFYTKGLDKTSNANEVLVTGSAEATVPKSDAFDAVVKGTVKLVQVGELISLKTLVQK